MRDVVVLARSRLSWHEGQHRRDDDRGQTEYDASSAHADLQPPESYSERVSQGHGHRPDRKRHGEPETASPPTYRPAPDGMVRA